MTKSQSPNPKEIPNPKVKGSQTVKLPVFVICPLVIGIYFGFGHSDLVLSKAPSRLSPQVPAGFHQNRFISVGLAGR
jgi:hypothetical protein